MSMRTITINVNRTDVAMLLAGVMSVNVKDQIVRAKEYLDQDWVLAAEKKDDEPDSGHWSEA